METNYSGNTPEQLASLAKKLVRVNQDVKYVHKTGQYNGFGAKDKYTYASEADVIVPVAKAFSDNGLAFLPSMKHVQWHKLATSKGERDVCTVGVEAIIIDNDTGGVISVSNYSCGGNQDKAINAAFTTAVKYLLAKIAMIPFGDDADMFDEDGKNVSGGKKPAADKPKAKAKAAAKSVAKKAEESSPDAESKPADDNQNPTSTDLEKLRNLISQTGTRELVKSYIQENGVRRLGDLSRDQYIAVVQSIKAHSEAVV